MSKFEITGMALVLAFFLFVVNLIQERERDKLPMDSRLPTIHFEGIMGNDSINYDIKQITVIIWFHPDCKHCQYQLNAIDAHINRLKKARFFLLTDKNEYFKSYFQNQWIHLQHAPNVRFGKINKKKFELEFGPVVSPSLFIFNQIGILKERLYGETKVEIIQTLIQNLLVPEQDESGLN